MKLKGKLIIIGGGEDKGTPQDKTDLDAFSSNGILERVVQESRNEKRSRIEIVPTASSLPKEVGDDYIEAFKKLGAENTGVISIESRDDAHKKEYLTRIEAADVVFFTGGDQLRLTSLLGGTPFLDLIKLNWSRTRLCMQAHLQVLRRLQTV
jgi:cyanophycinase